MNYLKLRITFRQFNYRYALIYLRLLILLIFILLTTGCGTFKEWQHLPVSKEDEQTIYAVSHGWHTGIVISNENLGDDLSFLKSYFLKSAFYEFGWGDEGFYQAEEISSGNTVRALFWPTPSVMHVVALSTEPSLYFPQSKTIELKVSSKGHGLLNKAIADSFDRNSDGEVLKSQKGIYGRSLFFKGKGSFFMTNTCNTWTARVLNKAGVPMRTFLTLTASSVMDQSREAMSKYECCQ